MICKTKTIILALALNASAVKISSMTTPDKRLEKYKDILKAAEKEEKEVRILKDDGLSEKDLGNVGKDDLNTVKPSSVIEDDGLSALNSADIAELYSNEAYWNSGTITDIFGNDLPESGIPSEGQAANTESHVFDGAENGELSFDEYFASASSEGRLGNGAFKFSKYMDRIQQDEFLDVLEEEGPEEAVDYLEMNVGNPWEKFGMSMDEFEEQLNKVVEKVWKEYSSIYEGAEADEGILEALGEGADDGADLLSRIDIRNPYDSGEPPEEYNIIGENHGSLDLNEFDDWQPLDNSDIEAIGEKYSDPNWWTKDLIDVEDLPLNIGADDSAVSAIDGATEALSGLGDSFLGFSEGNLEMLGFETAEMSTEEIIAASLAADLALVA